MFDQIVVRGIFGSCSANVGAKFYFDVSWMNVLRSSDRVLVVYSKII